MAMMMQADVPECQEERRKVKGQIHKRVHADELEVAEQQVGSKLPARQDSGHQAPAGRKAGGGSGKKRRLTESGGSGIQARIRAELKQSGASSSKSLAA